MSGYTTSGPVPEQWMREGFPPQAIAAFGEGCCPVHLIPLDAVAEVFWGREFAAGWCSRCRASWRRDEQDGVPVLFATWTTAKASDSDAAIIRERRPPAE